MNPVIYNKLIKIIPINWLKSFNKGLKEKNIIK